MKKRIVVVEDDPFSQEFYLYIFRKGGYEPEIIENGDLLIETLKKNDVHLIIMDINLKNTYLQNEKIDGIGLIKVIKEEAILSEIPILLVTAYSPNLNENYFFQQGLANDYIIKPIADYNVLLRKVKDLIN